MCAQILVETTYISFQLTSRDSIQNHFLSVTIITKLNPTSPKCLKMPRIATQESKAYTSNDLVSISTLYHSGATKRIPHFQVPLGYGYLTVILFSTPFQAIYRAIYLHTYANCISIVQNHLCYILAFTHQILVFDENHNCSMHRWFL